MNDQLTHKPFQVAIAEVAGPFLRVPLAQLPKVREALDHNAIWYWVDSEAISLDGRPPHIVINFGQNGNAARIQAALDEVG